MAKIIAIFVIVVLLGFISYKQADGGPQDERSAISEAIAIAAAKSDKPLKPEEESLLKLQLAIVDFTSRNSHPPKALHELAPVYFDTVPLNPTTGKDFPYSSNGRIYHLSIQAEESNQSELLVQLENGQDGNVALMTEDADFVNPNTLKEDLFIYDPKDKRDPFMPFNDSPKNVNVGATPLERIDLGEFRFTGVLSKPSGEKMAMVEDPVGHGYSVSVGTKIGINSGVVVDIQNTVFKVLETSVDGVGRVQQRIVEKNKLGNNDN